MRYLIVLLLASFSIHAKADKPTSLELEQALASYRDSAALLHKADSFIYARRAYKIARQLYPDDPDSLGPIAYTYALAASRYQEPVALEQYEVALELLTKANGPESDKLVPVLVDAAEEAIHRNEPEKAYLFTKSARDLIKLHGLDNSFLAARSHMALARQYWNSDEKDRAVQHAEFAKGLASNYNHETGYPNHANLLYWHAQIMRWHGDYLNAEPSYEKALGIFLAKEPRNRKVLSIHKHMVAVSHHLEDQKRLAYHCIEGEKWENVRGMSFHWEIYDPTGNKYAKHKPRRGQIIASYTLGTDCKAHNITILKTDGISYTEAAEFIARRYFPPRFREGKLSPDQLVDQAHFNVYESSSAK